VQGQYASNIKTKTISLSRDTVKLDSLSIVPGTMLLRTASGQAIDTSAYDFYPFASLLIWKKRPAGDTAATVSFRVYPFAYANRYFNKDHAAYVRANKNHAISPFVYVPNEVAADKLIDFGALDYNGNFSRGVGFGSAQSVTLSSSFNLQLQGMLAKDLEVTAAITDNNIPIQPEGNTQQIQEFDKIFIQLRYKKHTVIVGDFDMLSPADYFLHYTKKAQGGGYNGIFDFKKLGTLKTHIAAGISKGKFATNTLAVSEGNQGPYRLTGSNGESYLIVLANSEAVYINGTKLTRGANQDYIMDYNSGTVTFTPKRIITADLRVVVEFQYSEQSYQRTMVDARIEFQTKKLNTFFDFYSEQDSKNQGQNQTLTDNQKRFLGSLGDSTQKAFYTGVDTVAYDVNRILYARHDSVYFINGHSYNDTAYAYSTDSTKAIFAITFALVGEGLGDYVPAQTTANGRVFVYSPKTISGTAPNQVLNHTGSYMPIVTLVAPQLHQMYTLGASYAIDNRNKISAEVAMSNNDVNLFSNFDKKNDLGAAAKIAYNSEIIIKSDTGKGPPKQKLNLDFNYEFSQNTFRPIERYRTVEFSRDFNLKSNSAVTYNEHLASFNATYSFLNLGTVSYRFRTFIQDSVYKGFENYVAAKLNTKKYGVNVNASYLHTESQYGKSDFIRPNADFYLTFKALKGIKTGISFDHELNIYRDKLTDTLNTSLSHIWQNYHYYISSMDTTKNQYRIEYTLRTEEAGGQTKFKAVDRITNTVAFSGSVLAVKNQTLRWNLTYRNVHETDTARSHEELNNYYLGRVDYTFSVLKNLIKSSTLYEIGAGREQKVQLAYLVSPNNTGDYIWIGKDPSQPKQLQDFVPLTYRTDTSYIRSYTTTPEFYAVNSNTLNEVLNINPGPLLHNAHGFAKFISKMSITSNLQLTKKIFANRNVSVGDYFNPFPTGANNKDTNIVTLTLNNRNSIYINRLDPKINGQFDVNYSRGRMLLTSGLENRLTRTLGPTIRWNIYKQLNVTASYTNGLKANESDYDKPEAYRIVYNETNTELSYLFKSQIRIATSYYYGFKSNKEPQYGGQFAVINTVTLDFKYNRHNKTTVGAKLSYSSIGYGDQAYQNNQAKYAMLEGLQSGNNLIWNVGFEQRLSTSIQLILSYDGRKTGTDKLVNTARAEIRAIF
jgi:hypothetical protein